MSIIIDEIEIIPIDTLPTRLRAISTGKLMYGGKNSWIGRAVIVRIASGGVDGWGIIRPVNPFVGETASSVFSTLRDFYAPALVGKDALSGTALLLQCEKMLSGHPCAISVLDVAMHDLVGRVLGVPIYALLGGACRDKIPLEWSVGLSTPEEMLAEAEWATDTLKVPYLCFKVGPAEQIARDVANLAKVRAKLGSEIKIGIDANTSYDLAGAIRLVEQLREFEISYFEQPLPVRNKADHRILRERSSIPLMADESIYTDADVIDLSQNGAFDVFGLKFIKCGGLRRGRNIAAVAAALGYDVNCAGTANGSYLEALAGAHLSCAIPNHAYGAEFAMGLAAVERDPLILNEPVRLVDGHAVISEVPGHGAEIDQKELAKVAMARELVKRG
jgi:muconate cycloisomerase